MVVALVLDSSAAGNSWRSSISTLPPEVGGSFVTASIGMPRRERTVARRTASMLKKQGATAILLSRQLEVMLPEVAAAALATGLPRVTALDYADRLARPMLLRAADICGRPIAARKITIVDHGASRVDYELLLAASSCGGQLCLMTSRGGRADLLTERLMAERGVAVRTVSMGAVKSDVALLLDCGKGVRVVSRVVLDLDRCGSNAVDGRVFNTMSLELPAAIPLPKQLAGLERCALVCAAARRDATAVFRAGSLAFTPVLPAAADT